MSKIKDLKVDQKLHLFFDNDWHFVTVDEVDYQQEIAKVHFEDNNWTMIDDEDEFRVLITDREVDNVNKKISVNRPSHYGNSEIDLIDFWCERYSKEELRGAFKSQISKYVDRLGYKDDEIKELDKIIDYATRYRIFLKESQR